MSLTQEEVVELDKFLTRMDKRNRGWWVFRWMMLGTALLLAGAGLSAINAASKIAPAFPPKDPLASVVALDVHFAIQRAMDFYILGAIGFVAMSMGVFGIVITLVHWRRQTRDRLLVKLARSCLAGLVPNP